MKYALWLAASTLIIVVLIAGFIFLTTPKNDSIGVCVHSLSEKDAHLVSQSGAHWIRIDCNSSDSKFGDYLQNAKVHNLSVLAILDSWMFSGNTNFTLEEWNESVTAYVTKYANEVDAWEIWNEPANPKLNWTLLNLTIYQEPNGIQENLTRIVDFYYNMAASAHDIIRRIDTNASIILFGGLNLYSGGDPNLVIDREFARQLAARNIMQFGDAIAVHAYPWGNKPFSDWSIYYRNSLDYYRGLFGNQSLDIWVTETGQTISDGQAQYLNDLLDFFRGEASHVFWYALHDENTTIGDFGLVNADNSPRQAYIDLHNKLA